MTREEFIKILGEEGYYSYKIEGDKIVVTFGGYVNLGSLTSIPPGVEFKNVVDVYLNSLTGDWFSNWKGNMEGIESNRLLNLMISKGMFI